jgi:hypothetical protein
MRQQKKINYDHIYGDFMVELKDYRKNPPKATDLKHTSKGLTLKGPGVIKGTQTTELAREIANSGLVKVGLPFEAKGWKCTKNENLIPDEYKQGGTKVSKKAAKKVAKEIKKQEKIAQKEAKKIEKEVIVVEPEKPVAVVDEDKKESAKALLERLKASKVNKV